MKVYKNPDIFSNSKLTNNYSNNWILYRQLSTNEKDKNADMNANANANANILCETIINDEEQTGVQKSDRIDWLHKDDTMIVDGVSVPRPREYPIQPSSTARTVSELKNWQQIQSDNVTYHKFTEKTRLEQEEIRFLFLKFL